MRTPVVDDPAARVEALDGVQLRQEVKRKRSAERATGDEREDLAGPAHGSVIGIDIARLENRWVVYTPGPTSRSVVSSASIQAA